MADVISNNIHINYDDSGTGDNAFLFLTGWCDNRIQFGPLSDLLSKHRRVLRMDWRGHGTSESPKGDFGQSELVEDARAVIKASGITKCTLVAGSHAGWIALELAKQSPEVIDRIVFLDWIITEPHPHFLGALKGLQSEASADVRDKLFSMWTEGAPEKVKDHVNIYMKAYGIDMWQRAGREIERAYQKNVSPLKALERIGPIEVLHIFGQSDKDSIQAQEEFRRHHSWFHYHQLCDLSSHFPAIEDPEHCAEAILRFLADRK